MPRELKVVTDDFITVPKAAKELGKPKVTLYRWIDANKLIAVTFGGILFVPKSEVERLRKKNERAAEQKWPAANQSPHNHHPGGYRKEAIGK